MAKVAGNVEGLLTRSTKDWKTTLTSNGEMLGEVDIRGGGIFQGDSLSPLLFIIIMIPLSNRPDVVLQVCAPWNVGEILDSSVACLKVKPIKSYMLSKTSS